VPGDRSRPGRAVRPRSALFGWADSHGNGKLWVGGLWPHGVIVARAGFIQPDGSVDMKFGWWRKAAGALTITGRRLDAPAPPLAAGVPSGYGDTGFQVSGVYFPTEGCWQVTGTVASTSLTFVIKKTHAGTRTARRPRRGNPPHTARPAAVSNATPAALSHQFPSWTGDSRPGVAATAPWPYLGRRLIIGTGNRVVPL
jgi:hypothetical protein